MVYGSSPEAQPALQIRKGALGPAASKRGINVCSKVFPTRWVSEEASDVDENRVEQLPELVGMDFKIIEIFFA